MDNENVITTEDTTVDEKTKTSSEETAKETTYTEAEVQALLKDALQRETDRRVTPISHELKKTREQLEEIKKQSMTEAQRKQYEMEAEQKRYAEELNEKSLMLSKYMTIAELNKRGWDENLTEFLMDSTEDGIRSKADKLAKLIEQEVSKARSNSIAKSSIVPPSKSTTSTTVTEVDLNDPVAFARAVREGRATLS